MQFHKPPVEVGDRFRAFLPLATLTEADSVGAWFTVDAIGPSGIVHAHGNPDTVTRLGEPYSSTRRRAVKFIADGRGGLDEWPARAPGPRWRAVEPT